MFFTFLLIAMHSAIAQETNTNIITLKELLQQWNDSIGLQYSGKEELLNSCVVTDKGEKYSQAYLDRIIGQCGLMSKLVNDVVVIQKRTSLNLFDGFVIDSTTRKPIPNVTLVFGEEGVITDEDGYFIITSDKEELKVSVSHISYQPKKRTLSVAVEAEILLNLQNVQIGEVTVGSKKKMKDKSALTVEQLLLTERTIDAGFYRNLNDILVDSSFQTIQVPIKPIYRRHGIVYHRIKLPKKERKEVGNVFGFSDGTTLYINHRSPTPKRQTDFYRTERLGPYLYFQEIWRLYPNSLLVTWLAERLLDTETGEVFTLTRGTLTNIIADDEELLELFNAEKGKSGKLKLYLIEYLRRKNQENSEMK